MPLSKYTRPATPAEILLYQFELQLLTMLRHKKHPKGRINVQLLGCSSFARLFFIASGEKQSPSQAW
ncbi:MAG TPA: hypothetical protein VGM85_20275, partial [Paraburkholderia sp.]